MAQRKYNRYFRHLQDNIYVFEVRFRRPAYEKAYPSLDDWQKLIGCKLPNEYRNILQRFETTLKRHYYKPKFAPRTGCQVKELYIAFIKHVNLDRPCDKALKHAMTMMDFNETPTE